jgi:RNA polymerase sigma-70 factor (ECF subfamily)
MSDPVPTERDLVQRIRDGDRTAFRELFERYEAAARARIRARLPHALSRKIDPEDVLQDAWLVATQRFAEFEGLHEGSFGSWLLQIAEYKAREAVRYHTDAGKRDAHREVTRGARPDTCNFAGRKTTPSQVFMAGELQARADEALARLPEDSRHVVDLVQRQGCTLAQAAEVLGRSYEATKKLYARALDRLRDLMRLPP